MNLDDNVQSKLRERSIISAQEVALKVGDLFVAENIITKARRQLDSGLVDGSIPSLNESNQKTLLKG